jgi:serine/threonine protein phosphatase PrpC
MLSFPPSLESLVKEGYANPEVLNQDLLNNALEGKASDNITFVTLVIAPL